MPIVSTAVMRRAFLEDAGADYGDVVFFSQPAHLADADHYAEQLDLFVNITINTSQGPVVVEIPAAQGAGIFGSLNNAWQVPLAGYGPEGDDAGRGGRYLILPPGKSSTDRPGVPLLWTRTSRPRRQLVSQRPGRDFQSRKDDGLPI
jgi:hypothetical protein